MKTKTYTVWNRISLVWLIGLLFGLNNAWAGIDPTVTYSPSPTAYTYGTPMVASQLTGAATANVPGSWQFLGANGAVLTVGSKTNLNAGSQVVSAVFTPTDTATYNIKTVTAVFNVAPATAIAVAGTVTRVYGINQNVFTGVPLTGLVA
jgi:hypothetical protein